MKRISKKEAIRELAIRIIKSNAYNDKNHQLNRLAIDLGYLLSHILLDGRSCKIEERYIDDVIKYFDSDLVDFVNSVE